MMIRSAVALMSCALALGACSREAPPEPKGPIQASETRDAAAVGYACESGKTIAVAYPDAQTARLAYDGRDYVLTSSSAASGALYAGQGLEWRTVSREGLEAATLSRRGPGDQAGGAVIERCSRPVSALAPAPTGSDRPVSDLRPCSAADLRLTIEGGDAGAGNRVTTLGLRNAGIEACSLAGYPTVTLADAQDRVLTSVKAVQAPGNYFSKGGGPTPVALPPGGKAWFDLAWNVIPHESEGETVCPDAQTLRLTTPADAAAASLSMALTPCGRQIRVSPFRPVSDDAAAPASDPAN